MFNREGWPGIVALVLFVILMYNVLKNWQGGTSLVNAGFTGGVNMTRALEGR